MTVSRGLYYSKLANQFSNTSTSYDDILFQEVKTKPFDFIMKKSFAEIIEDLGRFTGHSFLYSRISANPLEIASREALAEDQNFRASGLALP